MQCFRILVTLKVTSINTHAAGHLLLAIWQANLTSRGGPAPPPVENPSCLTNPRAVLQSPTVPPHVPGLKVGHAIVMTLGLALRVLHLKLFQILLDFGSYTKGSLKTNGGPSAFQRNKCSSIHGYPLVI